MKKLFVFTVILILLPIRFGWGQWEHRVYTLTEPRPTGYWVEWTSARYIVWDSMFFEGAVSHDTILPDTHWVYPVEYEPVIDSTWVQTSDSMNWRIWIRFPTDTSLPATLERIPDSTWRIDTVGWVRK